MGTAYDMVRVAQGQMGYKESPAGSNKTKYGSWYGMNGEPWCDMFVSWCAAQIGEGAAVGKFAYTPYHANFFKKRGRWIGRNGTPIQGDLVFFANKGTICHVGIVQGKHDGKLVTIEGNTSASGSQDNGGMVCRKYRTLGTEGSSWYIAGYGRPDYSGSAEGWHKNSKGWWYQRKDGTYPKDGWEEIGGYWFLFDAKGYMLTGWQKRGSNWYYLKPNAPHSGRMLTGWLKDDGSWYYLKPDEPHSGRMYRDCFAQIDGKWYGFPHNGRMLTSPDQLTINSNGSINLG